MGKTIVITGGTSGIGLELKKLFEQNGDTVLTFSLDESGESNHYCGSVDHEIKVKQVFNDIHQNYGSIDILINCAGIGMSGITEIIPTEKIQKLTEVNYYGTLYCIRSALPFMNSGSRIVNISSAMALFPVPFRSIYGSVKSAVLNLSFSLRMELSPLGIDVVAFCPGDTKTNFTQNRIKEFDTTERYGDRIRTATERKDAKEDKKLSSQYVAGKIFKYSTAKKTKPFYIIGGKYKFLYFLSRITPKSLLLNATAKLYGGTTKSNKKKVEHVKTNENIDIQQLIINEVQDNTTFNEVQDLENKTTPTTETETTINNIEQETSIINNDIIIPNNNESVENIQPKQTPGLNDILSKIKIMNKPSDDNDNN